MYNATNRTEIVNLNTVVSSIDRVKFTYQLKNSKIRGYPTNPINKNFRSFRFVIPHKRLEIGIYQEYRNESGDKLKKFVGCVHRDSSIKIIKDKTNYYEKNTEDIEEDGEIYKFHESYTRQHYEYKIEGYNQKVRMTKNKNFVIFEVNDSIQEKLDQTIFSKIHNAVEYLLNTHIFDFYFKTSKYFPITKANRFLKFMKISEIEIAFDFTNRYGRHFYDVLSKTKHKNIDFKQHKNTVYWNNSYLKKRHWKWKYYNKSLKDRVDIGDKSDVHKSDDVYRFEITLGRTNIDHLTIPDIRYKRQSDIILGLEQKMSKAFTHFFEFFDYDLIKQLINDVKSSGVHPELPNTTLKNWKEIIRTLLLSRSIDTLTYSSVNTQIKGNQMTTKKSKSTKKIKKIRVGRDEITLDSIETLTHNQTLEFFNNLYDYVIVDNEPFARDKEEGKLGLFKNLKVIWKNKQTYLGDKNQQNGFQYWTENVKKRYFGIEFDPTKEGHGKKFNLWKGYNYETSEEGNCDLFLDHLKRNVCDNNEEHYQYVLDWFAQIIQQPGKKIGKVLALKGKQGTGKSIVGQIFANLFHEDHNIKFNDMDDLANKFNADFTNKIVVLCEETIWGGNKKSESKLKDLITSPTVNIEKKSKDRYKAQNHLRFILTSNERWMAPVSENDRRYIIFEVKDNNKQDKEYFSKMMSELENEKGYQKLLYLLQNRDISKRDFNEIPDTEIRRKHLLKGLSPLKKYIYESLSIGEVYIKQDDNKNFFSFQNKYALNNERLIFAHVSPFGGKVEVQKLFDSFLLWAKNNNFKHLPHQEEFIQVFEEIFGKRALLVKSSDSTKYINYIFITDIYSWRLSFEKNTGLSILSREEARKEDPNYNYSNM